MKDEDGKKVYQGAVLANYNSTTLQNCGNSALADVERLAERMQARLEWSNLELLRATVAFLDTMSWKRGEEDDDLQVIQAAVECLVSHFRQPLEAKAVDLAKLHDEVENVVTYARKYLSCETERYQQIWYKFHTSPVAKTQWPNVLQLSQLVFSLPFSNSHVEQLFSTLKMIKTERRTRLQTEPSLTFLKSLWKALLSRTSHQMRQSSYGGTTVKLLEESTNNLEDLTA